MKKAFKLMMICALGLGLSACTVGPDYQPPEISFLDRWFSSGEDAARIETQSVDLQWWESFNDPLLSSYIEKAAAHNKDVKIALANLSRARALRRAEAGAFWPSISGGAGAQRAKSSEALSSFNSGEIRNTYDAGFDASWALDLFGGTRRAVEAARAQEGAAQADMHAALLSTLSEVARLYYEARGAQKRIAITNNNVDLFRQSYDLIGDRLEAGEASAFDLTRAQGEYEATRARLPNLQAQLKTSIYSLSVMLGLPPEALLEEMEASRPLPAPPDIVPVGLRSDILRRRPDVRRAERALAEDVALIGMAEAELFPQFYLTGDVGTQARLFSDLFTAAGGAWTIAALMDWSVFEGGAIRARIDAAEADAQGGLAAYEKTVLEALADAESALVLYAQELETRKRLQKVVQSRRKAGSLARELFDAGEEDYLAILDAERDLTTAEDNLVVSETQSILKLVALYNALGGGWQVFTE